MPITSPSLKVGARPPASSASAALAVFASSPATRAEQHAPRRDHESSLVAFSFLVSPCSPGRVVIAFATSSAPQRANSGALSQRVPPPGYCRARRIASVIACCVSSKRPVQSRRAVGAS